MNTESRRLYEPGDWVTNLTGGTGRVLSVEELDRIKVRLPEGIRPGHFFAPGCCANSDYVKQVPVLFEDGAYDVMRAMNIRRGTNIPEDLKNRLEQMLSQIGTLLVVKVAGVPRPRYLMILLRKLTTLQRPLSPIEIGVL